MDCDTSMGNSATVTFTGAESDSLPGYLTPDAALDGLVHIRHFDAEQICGIAYQRSGAIRQLLD